MKFMNQLTRLSVYNPLGFYRATLRRARFATGSRLSVRQSVGLKYIERYKFITYLLI